MSECQKLYTEREVIQRERGAFEAPVQWGDLNLTKRIAMQMAEQTYPLPPKAKVTRPRVVKDEHGGEWCFRAWPKDSALLMYRKTGCTGWTNEIPMVSLEIAPTLAELFANPTEECEVDE